jgi:polyadenylate-binding protein
MLQTSPRKPLKKTWLNFSRITILPSLRYSSIFINSCFNRFSAKGGRYAYAYFENQEYAEKARKELNGEVLKTKYSDKGITKPLRICKYESKGQISENSKNINQNLLVKNVDRSLSAKDFYKLFEEYGDIKSCKLEFDENGVSKGYGYVLFNEGAAAEGAKNALVFY